MKSEKGKQRSKELKKRRMRAAGMFDSGKSQAYVVSKLEVSRQSASRWYHAWKERGRKGLIGAERAGRKPRLNREQIQAVERALRRGPLAHGYPTDLWTLARLSAVIEKLTGVHYHPGHVWKVMDKIGWSLQRPAKRARERNKKAIALWMATVWPSVKKKRSAGRLGSSSRTKAVSPSDLPSEQPGLPEDKPQS